ncbi:MAG: glycosyltransferase [Candidatus Paceibacterota bacterium]
MELSIIIPTLNEEKRLPALLHCIKADNYNDYEIIIADAGSKDATRDIALAFGCQIVKGGLPAKGRNEGSKVAKGEFLLFLDADIQLPENFLSIAMKERKERSLDVSSFPIQPMEGNLLLNKATLNVFYNIWMEPMVWGAMAIMCRKTLFQKVGGFDEAITLAEDHYFMSQAAKIGTFGIIQGTKFYMPTRRFEKDGYMSTFWKYLICGIRLKTIGPDRGGKFKYEFDHYDEKGQ